MTKELSERQKQAARILQEIDDTEWHRHWYPHMGLVPDWYVRWRDLAIMVRQYILDNEKPDAS